MNLIICLFWCYFWLNTLAYNSSIIKLVDKEVQHLTLSSHKSHHNNVKNKWFEQELDHFNATDTRTWKQRYHMNLKYYKMGGPVFLMVGGREEISQNWMISGAWIEYAQMFNAACFQLEHRYYGMSHPTENLNTTNLVYLTIEQVLADLATFINTISIEKKKLLNDTKWVGFGSSYSGSLVTWLRLKYPHLIHAAVSSSSLLKAKVNFEEYFVAVQKILTNYNPMCEFHIRQANKMIGNLIKTDYGAKYIQKKFNICAHHLNNSTKNVQQLFRDISRFIGLIVQDNEDNRYYNKMIDESTVTLVKLCDIMSNETFGCTIDRYAAVIKNLLSVCGTQCLSNTYEWRVRYFAESFWNNTAVKYGNRQWLYQTCTEFGFFQTSTQDHHLFGNTVSLEYFTDLCADVFGKSFNLNALSKAVNKTNMMYGGSRPRANRIIFVRGSIDPWNPLGLSFLPINSSTIFIKGTSHCADINPSYSSDPTQLLKARIEIVMYLKKYLNEKDFSIEPILL
ncbi:putative serine protease K12H4.7 isoform X1 [Aphis gossypii]|uniref:putative serine protease K12H4.7 isoform X1 n=1 Tax=Aphis gossypii TaxID=80765 RepID=UPI0021596F63|nr:putative serine protease K12H4.7 isoform X1 [Aphis gossypii]